eukprot:3153877-Prymnesium_polylepis.1
MRRVLMLDLVFVLVTKLFEVTPLVDGKDPPRPVTMDLNPREFQARADGVGAPDPDELAVLALEPDVLAAMIIRETNHDIIREDADPEASRLNEERFASVSELLPPSLSMAPRLSSYH